MLAQSMGRVAAQLRDRGYQDSVIFASLIRLVPFIPFIPSTLFRSRRRVVGQSGKSSSDCRYCQMASNCG